MIFVFLSENKIHSLKHLTTNKSQQCVSQVCRDRPVFVTADLSYIILLVCFLFLVSTVLPFAGRRWMNSNGLLLQMPRFKRQHNDASVSSRRSLPESFDPMNEIYKITVIILAFSHWLPETCSLPNVAKLDKMAGSFSDKLWEMHSRFIQEFWSVYENGNFHPVRCKCAAGAG